MWPDQPQIALEGITPRGDTGTYAGSVPGDDERKVNVKAELANIRADRERDNENAARARDMVKLYKENPDSIKED